MGSFGMSRETQMTRSAPRGTLLSRVSCWRSGRFVDATTTFLLATARMEASCDPENITFEKWVFGSTLSSIMKKADGTRYPEVEFGSLKANVRPARSSGEKMSESACTIRHDRYPSEPLASCSCATGSMLA